MVDFACVIQVMLDHRGYQPTGLSQLAPEVRAGAEQFGIVEGGYALAENLVGLTEPVYSRGDSFDLIPAVNKRIVPVEGGLTKGVVVIEELGGANMLDDVTDRSATTRGNPQPVVRCDGLEVAEEGVPFCTVESPIEEIEDLGDSGRSCGCHHKQNYTVSLVVWAS